MLGFLLLRSTWIRWEALATDNEAERASSLRRLYLYAALLISGVTALVAIATTLRIVLLIAFGAEQGETSEIIDQIVAQAGLFSAGLGSWLWFRSHVRQEVRLYAESEAGATARRLYFYVLAGLGLGLMWVGAGDLIQAFLSRIFGQGGTQPLWTSPLATGLSLLIVGTPVWTLHWRTVQQRVDGDSRAAFAERHAWPRRFYLFAAILVGALIFLFQLARVVYTVLLLLLGDPFAEFFSLETTAMIAGAAIAALVWTGHAALLRRDNQILAVSPYVEEETQPVDAVQQRQRLNAQIARLEAELATARQALEALEEHPQD